MLEQQLINAFMKFTAKAGAGEFIRDLVIKTDENGNPKSWTAHEMQTAIDFLHSQTDRFGKAEAIRVIKALMKKFELDSPTVGAAADDDIDVPGVKGLQ